MHNNYSTHRFVGAAANLLPRVMQVAGALLVSMFVVGAVQAKAYPNKPLRLVVPFAVGGTTDTLARLYAETLARALGQPVIIENRPGASSNIGNRIVADAPSDGYTLLFGASQMTQSVIFGPFPAVEPENLTPVSLVASSPQIIATHPKSPYKNIQELIAVAGRAPGTVSIASAQLHLYVSLLNQKAGIQLLHVPYKGGAPALVDTIGGRTDLVMSQSPNLLQYIDSGELRPIGVLARERVEVLPDVPTFEEAGVSDLEIVSWFGVFVPKGTPQAIIDRLAAETKKAVKDPIMGIMAKQGLKLEASSPTELNDRVMRDLAFWRKVALENPSLVTAK